MPQINYNPTVSDLTELSKAIKYSQSYDTIETSSSMNSSANISCSSLNVSTGIFTSTVTAPTITTSTFLTSGGATMKMMSGVSINGDLTLENPTAYVDFYSNMMKAVYGSDEKDQEFCMPSTKAKKYLGQLVTHMNDEDADKVLRALYYTLSQLPVNSDQLPSASITASILEFAVKENL